MSTESKVLLGVAGAALAGLAIGMLTAPCSGDETREKLRGNVNTLSNRLLDALRSESGTFADKVEDAVDTAKAKFNEAKGYVRAEANHVRNQVENSLS